MGARLSQPKGPAGTTEASVSAKAAPPPTPKSPFNRRINSRTIVAPAAAFTMALLLFVYARTSIRAAKANAQRHREADSGGEGLSLLNESRRRHGMRESVERGGTVTQLASEARAQIMGGNKKKTDGGAGEAGSGRSEDERLRALKGKIGKKSGSLEG